MRLSTLAAAVVALFLISLAIFEGFGLYSAYHDLKAGAATLQSASSTVGTQPANWTPDNVARAQRSIGEARTEIDRARARVDGDPLLSAAGVIPGASDQVRAIREVTGAEADTGAASEDLLRVAALYADTATSGGAPGARVIQILTQSEPLLADARRRLDRSLATVNRDRGLRLLPPLRSALDRAAVDLARADQEAAVAADLAATLPAALGATTPRRYLLLLANPTELRPDGGFAGVVGTMTLDHGNPTSIHLVDQFSLNPLYKQKFPIPAPLAQHMRFYDNSLEIGDAGWDPNFPATAALTEQMWKSATSEAVDGVIVIDPYAIQQLMTVTGPVTVAGVGTFDSSNLLDQLNVLINVQGGSKQTVVPAVAGAVIKAILSVPGAHWARLMSILIDQARQRHIQLALHDQALQKVIAGASFDGALLAPAGDQDYLMVVDANLGATKGDAYVQKQVAVKVEKPADGLTRHQVTASYVFPKLTSATDLKLNPPTPNNPTGAYRDYVRFYLPQAANLTGFRVQVDGKPTYSNSIAENEIQNGKRVVGAFIEIPPGHSGDVSFTYDAPLNPEPRYSLELQKQAGRPSLPTTLEVSYPGGIANRKTDLVTDSVLEVRW